MKNKTKKPNKNGLSFMGKPGNRGEITTPGIRNASTTPTKSFARHSQRGR